MITTKRSSTTGMMVVSLSAQATGASSTTRPTGDVGHLDPVAVQVDLGDGVDHLGARADLDAAGRPTPLADGQTLLDDLERLVEAVLGTGRRGRLGRCLGGTGEVHGVFAQPMFEGRPRQLWHGRVLDAEEQEMRPG